MISIEGNIVNIGGTNRGRVEIGDDGIIISVGPETGKADIVLGEELIFPGFVDLHVHARECADHSQDYKEDFVTAGEAAINGGVVAFADMPNNPVPPVDDKSYGGKYQLTKKCAADVLLYAGTGSKTAPFSSGVILRSAADEGSQIRKEILPLRMHSGSE
jgi:dihydroorotase